MTLLLFPIALLVKSMSNLRKKFHFEQALYDVRSSFMHLQHIDHEYMKHVSRNQRTSMYHAMELLHDVEKLLDNVVKSIRLTKQDKSVYVRMSEPVDGIDDLDEDIPF